jgi:arylsulfatase A
MGKHLFHIVLIGTFALWLFNSCTEEVVQPNIILILADDQGWGATSVQVDPDVRESASDFIRTPRLENLAARGMVFSNGYAPHANCSPSRAAILTGKPPARLHLTDIVDRHSGPLFEGNRLIPPPHAYGLDTAEITIAELIKKERPDYATAHFGKWHLAAGGPETHGFDASHGETWNREGNNNPPEDPKKIFTITRDGIEWMEEQVRGGRPFYLQLSHYATHLQTESRPETLSDVDKRKPGGRHLWAPYAAMAEDLDTGVGMILDMVDSLGIRDHTYVIYLADNGTYPTPNPGNINGPLHGWKATLWEGGLRVPFIIAGPGIKPGNSRCLVTGCDLFPTICDWLHISQLPEGVEGGSLVPVLSEPDISGVQRKRDFWVFHFPHYQHQKGNHPVSAIYKDQYKLLRWYEDTTIRLYDLKNDLAEATNLVPVRPGTAADLNRLLEEYLEDIGAGLPEVNPEFDPALDPAQKHPGVKDKLMEISYFVTD